MFRNEVIATMMVDDNFTRYGDIVEGIGSKNVVSILHVISMCGKDNAMRVDLGVFRTRNKFLYLS